jgi:hypothetical protein
LVQLAEIPAVIFVQQLLDQISRAILAAVVHENDLIIPAGGIQDLDGLPDAFFQDRFFVITGDHQAEVEGFVCHVCLLSAMLGLAAGCRFFELFPIQSIDADRSPGRVVSTQPGWLRVAAFSELSVKRGVSGLIGDENSWNHR